jgi:MFS family permease
VALAPWFWAALLGRAVQGFGSGGIFPVAAATIGDIYPPQKRGGPLGLMGMVLGIAFIVGPIVAGVVLFLNWRWLFLINLPIGLAIAFFALRYLPTRRAAERKRFDWPGMTVIGIMLWSLAFGANRIDTSHFLPSLLGWGVLPFLILPFLFLPFLIFREERASWPVIAPSMFRTGQLRLSYALSFGSGFIQASMIFVPALVQEVMGTSASSASFLLLPLVLSMAVFAPIFGRLLGKIGARAVVNTGTVVLTAGFLLLALFARHGAVFILAMVLVGIGLAVMFGAPLRYVMLNEAEEKDRTTVQALGNLFSGTGQILSSALIGAIVASAGGGLPGYRHAYETAGLVAFLLFLVSLGLRKGRQKRDASRR